MTKFQKVQRWICFIPYLSTLIILLATMFTMKKNGASRKQWIKLIVVFFASIFVVHLVFNFVMTGQNILLSHLVNTLLLAIPNLLYIDIQSQCTSQKADETETVSVKMFWPVIFGVTGVLVVIGVVLIINLLVTPPYTIEDTNGPDDSSLAVLTLEEIITGKEYWSSRNVRFSNRGNDSNVSGDLEEYDYETCTYKAQVFNGYKILQATKTNADSITLQFTTERHAGNMEIIVIVDGTYYCHVDTTGTQSVTVENISGKTVLVKIAGESAQFEVAVTRVIT